MWYVIASLLGMLFGGSGMYFVLENKRRQVNRSRDEVSKGIADLREARQQFRKEEAAKTEQLRQLQSKLNSELQRINKEFQEKKSRLEAKIISYDEITGENVLLKDKLRELATYIRKLSIDRDRQQEFQNALDVKCRELGSQYLKESVKWISRSLTSNNYANSKTRLSSVVEKVRGIGIEISTSEEEGLTKDLKSEFEHIVRVAAEREEQARIKARIREEQAREREIQSEVERLDREQKAIEFALEKALAETKEEHAAEVEELRKQLAEAEEKSRRAIAQAQLTKSGHVYVVSNIGSFGDGIFKVGMTRRLEPYDRIKELGDASVPFPFDIHMMVSCEDAPALEIALHRALHEHRVNKVNPRKEFFRTTFEAILKVVQEHEGEVEYTADVEALEYRQSISMSNEDAEFIEGVYGKFEDDAGDEAT